MAQLTVPIVVDWDSIQKELDEHDIVEVVRCKDCKHGSPNGKYGCTVYHYKKYETHNMKPEDFCSRAERREAWMI